MSQYLLISSRDPYECRETENFYRLAINLKNAGHGVTLFLVQNGVLPARKAAVNREFAGLIRHKITIEVDEFSAQERGLPAEGLKKGTGLAPLEHIVDALARGTKTLWH